MKPVIRVLALILLLSVLSLPLGACGAVSNPLRYLKNATLKTFRESAVGQIAEVLAESTSDGAVSLSFTGAGEENGFSAGALTAYFSPRADRVALSGNVTLAGKTYDAELFLDGEAIVMRSTAFLGSSTLGITLDTLEKDIASSIFRNNSGTAYADPDVDDTTAGEISGFVENFFALYSDADDMAKLADDVLDTFLSALEKYANTSYYRQDGNMYVTVSVDNGALSSALRETRKELVSSRQFCRKLRKWAKEYDAMISATSGVVTNTYGQKAEDFLTNDAGTEEVCAAIDKESPFVLKAEAVVRRSSRTAEKLTVSLSKAGTVTRSVSFDRTEENTFRFSLVAPEGTREFSLRNISDTRKEYRADLSFSFVTASGESDLSEGSLVYDKKNETYTLTLTRDGETRTVNGTFSLSRSHWKFSVDSVRVGETALASGFAFEATVGADFPETPEYTNLFTMDSNRFKMIDSILAPAKEQFEADMERLMPDDEKMLEFFYDVLGLDGILPTLPEEDNDRE